MGASPSREGKWKEAAVAYEEAYRTRAAWDIAGNLGIAYLESGRLVLAAKYLEEALRGFPGTGKPEQRVILLEAYEKARAQVGALAIRTSPDRANIYIDNAAIGTTPFPAPQFVEVGRHRVEAKQGNMTASQVVDARAGQELEVVLTLAGSSLPPTGTDDVESTRSPWPLAVIIGGASVAAIGLGVGITGLVVSGGKRSDAEDVLAEIAGRGERCPGAAECQELRDTLGTGATWSNVGVAGLVGMGVGIAATAAGIVWLAVDGKSGPSALGPAPAGADVGGGLRLQF